MQLIQDTSALADFCSAIETADCIAVDTEFLRERTYYPQLCLVQVATRDALACIDTLAIDDLQPLLRLLSDTTITKVLHAARQDMEVLLLAGDSVPVPVFDTQIAADLCGIGNQVGLALLSSELMGVEVDKTHARADWSKRPLTDTLLEYAANDVLNLVEIYEKLQSKLRELGRLDWLLQECLQLADPGLYQVDPEQAWRRIRGITRLPSPGFHVARELAQWREQRAMSRDRPRNWILRDDALFAIAECLPSTMAQLQAIDAVPPQVIRHGGQELLASVAQGAACTEPAPEPRLPLDEKQKRQVKAALDKVRQVAKALDISPSLLATRKDVTRLVRGRPGGALMTGWRYEVVGQALPAVIADS